MPNSPRATHQRRATTPQTQLIAGKQYKANEGDSQQVVKRAVLEATLTNLRSKLKDIEQDKMTVASIKEDTSPYVPIGQRPEWANMQPRLPPASNSAVVEIARDQQFGDLMDYFWAAVDAQDVSERVLSLTEEIIIELNSSNYTVWEWRWRCIQALGGIKEHAGMEQALMQRVAHDNPKSYQLWNHRRRFALSRGAEHAEQDLDFAAESLAFDAKNYHAWAHRQAVLAAFATECEGMWLRELAYTERLLREDVRNNSAWNHRYFVICQGADGCLAGTHAEIYNREVTFVITKIKVTPHSESGWNYLRGLAQFRGAPSHAEATDANWLILCKQVLTKAPSCTPALALLADIYVEQALLLTEASSIEQGGNGLKGAKSKAVRLASDVFAKLLVTDPLRSAYYNCQAAMLPQAQ